MTATGSAPDAAIPERIWVEIAREMADDGSHSVVDLSVVDGPDPHADYPYQEVVEYVRARPVEATGGERGEVTGMDGDANEDDWP